MCVGDVQVTRNWMSPWTHGSFRKLEIPSKFLPASSIKIGTTVTKLTDTENGCVLGCGEIMYCWCIVNWIPLWYNWSILKRKLIYVRCYVGKSIMKLLLNIITGLSVPLSLHPSAFHPFINPFSFHPPIRPFIYLNLYPTVCRSIHQYINPSIKAFIHPSINYPVHTSKYEPIHSCIHPF